MKKRRRRRIAKNPSGTTYVVGILAAIWIGGAIIRRSRHPNSLTLGLEWPYRGLGLGPVDTVTGRGLSGVLAVL